tara:strand:- start:111 stop:1871 length:1761 start_codon:yes stop_codon:yes gene_type:complete
MDTKLSSKKQFGENGHVEETWVSENTEELLVKIYFQLVRTSDESKMTILRNNLHQLIRKSIEVHGHIYEGNKTLTMVYKLIGHIRDCVHGKGEYNLAFMMLEVWWQYYPDLAIGAFLFFVKSKKNPLAHQYGSWKDVKYMCDYLSTHTIQGNKHPFIDAIIQLVVSELNIENNKYNNEFPNFKPSLIGKWIPREKSKRFGWIFKRIAKKMFSEIVEEPRGGWKSLSQQRRASNKTYIRLRKILSRLNKSLDTAQIKFCNNQWSKLEFNKVTSITLRKQKNAIMNVDKKGNTRSNNEDRVKCAQNYKQHVNSCLSGNKKAKIHGRRCTVGDLSKDALTYLSNGGSDTVRQTINLQWEDNKKNNGDFGEHEIIAMCDTSGSMEADNCIPLYNSIGLSIRAAESCKTALHNRVMVFNDDATWVKFDDDDDFVTKVKKCKNMNWGTSTNFHKALDNIIQAFVENNVEPKVVKNCVLAVFSDMQMNCSWHNLTEFSTVQEAVRIKFHEAGMNTKYRQPYVPPHILFWNLRATSGFPSTTFTENISFLGGYNSTLLNIFCEKGIDELRKQTPFTMLRDMLDKERYNVLLNFV